MHVNFRLPYLSGVLLLAATSVAGAESPMAAGGYPLPDPVAPAVVGRPLDQIRPARSPRPKPMPLAAKQGKKVTAASKPKPAAKPAAAPAPATAAAKPAAPAAATAVAGAGAAPPQQAAKVAVDDRVDPNAPVRDNVGQGSNLARKRLAPGAYLGSRHQALVRQYYEAHPVRRTGGRWQIGDPLPEKVKLEGVPDRLRAALPRVPPGHQYVQVDGEVVLVAMGSRMVVDGVPRAAR